MEYAEALAFFHSAPRFKGSAGLTRMARLCEVLGGPQKALRFVHVAGTNGKGSTCRLLASALTQAGYRTGLFTSPFVVDFRERFQVDGRMISRERLCALAGRVRAAARQLETEGLWATEFDLVTACGFLHFLEERCDVVVLEVGLGGRLDATNVIPAPECAVITKIALDHTAILGGTLEEIAAEKCGILKPGTPAVSYPQQDPAALAVIKELAKERGCPLRVPDPCQARPLRVSLSGCRFLYRGSEWRIPLGGAHQIQNALTALTALDALRERGFAVSEEDARRGFASASIPARLEQVSENPPILIDGAHNPDGALALAAALGETPRTVIFAAMRDKDYTASARLLCRGARRFIACGLSMERAAAPRELLAALEGAPHGELLEAPDAAQALALARRDLTPGELIVVCGSLYLAADARALLCPLSPEEDGDATQ